MATDSPSPLLNSYYFILLSLSKRIGKVVMPEKLEGFRDTARSEPGQGSCLVYNTSLPTTSSRTLTLSKTLSMDYRGVAI